MNPPTNQTLPFFAYGVFRPGELAFLQIKEFVESCRVGASIRGVLRIRDGLPIASPEDNGEIFGTVIKFRPGSEAPAYQRIADLEPDKQYRWEVASAGFEQANFLAGRSPRKGSDHPEEEWNGRADPLFTVALDVVAETLQQNQKFEWDLKPLFRLEMAYLLLWTAIERYASLRYHLGDKATKKVLNLANERSFQEALLHNVRERREVSRADDPTGKCVMDMNVPPKALAYYYQIRSNLVHRGKGVVRDHERIEKSLQELLVIFRATLAGAFEESEWPSAVE